MILRSGSALMPTLVGSLLIRTPSVGLVLFMVSQLVRWRGRGPGRAAPFLWCGLRVIAGYFALFVILSLLADRTLWDQGRFEFAHEDWGIFATFQGPYVAAFLVTSALYWAGLARLAPRLEVAPLAS